MTPRLLRFDRHALPSKVTRTGAGAIRVPATVAKAGVQTYSDGIKTWTEFRPPEEVFAPASLASARAVPVTIKHEGGLISPETITSYQHGHAGDNPRRDGNWLRTDLVITTAKAIKGVDARDLCEISAGYDLEHLEQTPGVWHGQHYDCIQRGITYNHFTLLPKGHARAGAGARVHLDSAFHTPVNLAISVATFGARTMKFLDLQKATARLDGVDYDLSNPESAKALSGVIRAKAIPEYRADALDAATAGPILENMKGWINDLIDSVDGLIGALVEGAEAPGNMAEVEELVGVEVMDSFVTERAKVCTKAKGYGVEIKGKTSQELMRATAIKAGRMDDKSILGAQVIEGIFIGLPDKKDGTWTREDQATVNSGAPENKGEDPRKERAARRQRAANWRTVKKSA